MRNPGDRTMSHPTSNPSHHRKRLGGYLVEAGLLTPAQVDVALNDQKLTGMRFGEILAARGWVKQQTIEYLMKKIVLPEQEAAAMQEMAHKSIAPHDPNPQQQNSTSLPPVTVSNPNAANTNKQALTRREIPISKPLPSVGSSDDGVSWVG